MVLVYEWSEWTKGLRPRTTCRSGGYTATVTQIPSTTKNDFRNCSWRVRHERTTIASGFTKGSSWAFCICEKILGMNGAEMIDADNW
jgi:hypothetical protein